MPAHRPPGTVCWGDPNTMKVKYEQPKGRFEWRPLWQNHNNPMQYDKSYLTRNEIAREKTMKAKEDGRIMRIMAERQAEMGGTAVGWNNGLTRPEEANGRSDPLARSLSQPIMGRTCSFDKRTFDRIAAPEANCTIKLSGDTVDSHLPGYRGNIRGWQPEANRTIGHRFARATTSLHRLHSPRLQTTPAPYLPGVGGTGTGNPFGSPDLFYRTR